ncbi:hypothetical protein [Kribbella sp. CA-294648]|uniref:hypothetical protein n=1 Tax=Kribbella sp. CA-294648 TaxID=3239948 RepID=UPI003D8DB70D
MGASMAAPGLVRSGRDRHDSQQHGNLSGLQKGGASEVDTFDSEVTGLLSNQLDEPRSVLTTLDELINSGRLATYLKSLLVGRSSHRLEEIYAFEHPNGFTKVVLADRSGAWSLRLHYWPPGVGDVDIHSHRWHFASFVLKGTIQTSSHQVSVGTEFEMLDCFPSERGDYRMEHRGIVGLTTLIEQHHSTGDTYFHSLEGLHKASVETESFTMVLHGMDLLDHSTVIRRRHSQPRLQEGSSVVPNPRLRKLLEFSLGGLDGERSK